MNGDEISIIDSEIRRLREKYNCSVVIEVLNQFYDFRPEPCREYRVCILAENTVSKTTDSLSESIIGAEAQMEKNTPEYRAELMRKNAAELLKQAEELSPTKPNEQPPNQD